MEGEVGGENCYGQQCTRPLLGGGRGHACPLDFILDHTRLCGDLKAPKAEDKVRYKKKAKMSVFAHRFCYGPRFEFGWGEVEGEGGDLLWP